MKKIVTDFSYPPIPLRQFDWIAWFDGQEDGAQGTGPTEQEAIDDLKSQVEDRHTVDCSGLNSQLGA